VEMVHLTSVAVVTGMSYEDKLNCLIFIHAPMLELIYIFNHFV